MRSDDRARAIRSFNRFYTKQIGLLNKGYLDSPFSLTEMRVLYELAHRDAPAAAELSRDLDLDAGYLSRMLLRFEKRGWLRRDRIDGDARRSRLSLTRLGLAKFRPFEAQANREIRAMLDKVPEADQQRLIEAMQTIQELLASASK